MSIVKIEESVKKLVSDVLAGQESTNDFIYQLLLAYGQRTQTIGRLKSGERNLAKDKQNSLLWKQKLLFKVVSDGQAYATVDDAKNSQEAIKNKVRFIIATDFKQFLAIDLKTGDSLDIAFKELHKKFDFFLPWAGIEKAVYQGENPADVKAAEKLAKLFDEIKADNFSEEDLKNKEKLHQLNIFLSRLLFCYFAEDTQIFADKQFTKAIGSYTREDGSDLSDYLSRLFEVLNQDKKNRSKDLSQYLADFPYVNGGLFKDTIVIPKFSRKSRRILIECGAELDWSDINPDIFGSMFQAVVDSHQRSNMGQHYTSVPNIMKVIEPLFLNELYDELERSENDAKKLQKLQLRLGEIKIFDPACGSGNFLIIAYKELRKFEMEVLKQLQELDKQYFQAFSVLSVSQFYGIEIDDFAHEIAILSLWLAEHQMNLIFKDEFGEAPPTLPLKASGNIVCANALLLDWNSLFGKNPPEELYILGNPPYLGSKLQTVIQKNDLNACFSGSGIKANTIDLIYGWFYKASQFIHNRQNQYAFVTTNSIFQGEQVATIHKILKDFSLDIKFAYQSFKWTNNARSNAGVTCVIVGIGAQSLARQKYILNGVQKLAVKNINSYLIDSLDIVIKKRDVPISDFPRMNFGNMPNDGGGLILNELERNEILLQYPNAKNIVRELIGAKEFIRGAKRYCLWIDDEYLNEAMSIPMVAQRIAITKAHRLSSSDPSCNNLAERSHQFRDRNTALKSQLIVPGVSSENRQYIPMGILGGMTIISNSAMVVYDPEPWLFSVLMSKMHMEWINAIGGKLETRYRYSAQVVYNNFPLLPLNKKQKEALTKSAFNILATRENYPEKTLADLYDTESMPDDLREAHRENDILVDSLYQKKAFTSDEDRLEALFKLYVEMTEGGEDA